MCVILEKIANQEIPYESLVASAHRNPDGWGVVIPQGSTIEILRGLTTEPQAAADAVAKALQGRKDELAFVHFRYRTVGKVDVANTQPICLMKKNSGDECDMVFMHNGTLDEFKLNSAVSDSIIFAQTIVEPLVRRSASYMGVDRVLEDPLIGSILHHYSEKMSKFVVLDSGGNSLVINRSAGVELPFGWASNKYSLDPGNVGRYEDKKKKESKGKIVYPSAWPEAKKSALAFEIGQNKKYDYSNIDCCHPSIRMTVQEATGFTLDDFEYLDQDQLRTLVNDEPDLATLLLMDLLYERSTFEYEVRKEAA